MMTSKGGSSFPEATDLEASEKEEVLAVAGLAVCFFGDLILWSCVSAICWSSSRRCWLNLVMRL